MAKETTSIASETQKKLMKIVPGCVNPPVLNKLCDETPDEILATSNTTFQIPMDRCIINWRLESVIVEVCRKVYKQSDELFIVDKSH